MRTTPILKLSGEENVKSMFLDPLTNAVLVGTSQGRILLIKQLASNAYLSGKRTIYSSIENCNSGEAPVASVDIQYRLANHIIALTDTMEIANLKSVNCPLGAESYSKVSGIFTTPVLWAGEDFGWWSNLSWVQNLSLNSRVVLAIRIAGTAQALLSTSWTTYESTTSGTQSWSIDDLSMAGGYAQIKIILESSVLSDSPKISALVLPYQAKHASYFFVTKIVMTKGTSIQGGLLTASVSTPRNTEIKWGIANNPSSNWNDFINITPDKLFTLPHNFGDRMKLGVKMLSYDNERYPSIDEFAIAFDANIDNLINKE